MLSLDDLSRAAAGCRALANVHRRDAERQVNPMLRDQLEREVKALTNLAERFDRTAAHRLKAAETPGAP